MQRILEDQSRLRRIQVFQLQPTGLDDAFKIARLQGEVAGLQAVASLLDLLIQDMTAEIEQKLAEEREEINNG